MVSPVDRCKRVLVSLIRALAATYRFRVTVTRDSADADVRKAYRDLPKKVHPDHGGSNADQSRLNAAYGDWCDKVGAAGRAGRPSSSNGLLVPAAAPSTRRAYRFDSQAALLTYQGFAADKGEALAQWARFVDFVKGSLRTWEVARWTATLESNKGQGHHAHLMAEFFSKKQRSAPDFAFEGLRPNTSANDLLGESFAKKRWRASVDRGHFFCFANKLGTLRDASGELCVAGNYAPAWTGEACNYPVQGAWPEKLWKAYKLDDDQYVEYLHLSKDGLPGRLRNFEVYQKWKRKKELEEEVAARTKRIRENPNLYEPFAVVQEAEDWKERFQDDALRYPVLLVHAPSHSGKTEWACSLFKNPLKLQVGSLTHFPDGARRLDRKKHDGMVLDDVRDLQFLHEHQHVLQGKYSGTEELGSTPSGQYAYEVDFFRLPIVLTVNDSTRNLSFLTSHDFVSKKENVRFLSFTGRPGQAPPTDHL